jgi:uncharacterized protein YhaN
MPTTDTDLKPMTELEFELAAVGRRLEVLENAVLGIRAVLESQRGLLERLLALEESRSERDEREHEARLERDRQLHELEMERLRSSPEGRTREVHDRVAARGWVRDLVAQVLRSPILWGAVLGASGVGLGSGIVLTESQEPAP